MPVPCVLSAFTLPSLTVEDEYKLVCVDLVTRSTNLFEKHREQLFREAEVCVIGRCAPVCLVWAFFCHGLLLGPYNVCNM
jgi:hypothetical protein